MAFVLYGIVRAEQRLPDPPPLGIGDPPGELRLIRSGSLAAAVSELAEIGNVGDAEALTHFDILIRLLEDGPVAPLRLGSVAPDETAVRAEVLDPVAGDLRDRLDDLEGLVELHLDADEDTDAAVRAVVAADPTLAAAVLPDDLDGRIEVGQRVADRVVERRAVLAEDLVAPLRPLAEQDSPRGPQGGVEDPMLRWAFLVRADRVAAFDDAVADLRAGHPELAVEYVGPLPPATFLRRPAPAADVPAGEFGGAGRWGWESAIGDAERSAPL
jgi:Gas vesicle synthesis protein GvpL/GvpF